MSGVPVAEVEVVRRVEVWGGEGVVVPRTTSVTTDKEELPGRGDDNQLCVCVCGGGGGGGGGGW